MEQYIYYDVKCYKTGSYNEDGFLNMRIHPLYITPHAVGRMKERLNLYEPSQMRANAFEAYQFGKSKRQLMKSERGMSEQKANQKPMFKIRLDKLREVAPKIKDNEFEAFVVKACAYYYKHQQKEKMKDAR